ncbi:MAG: ankyrin repeat domain-containing protein, partial [Azonexus sp.]
MPSKLIEVVKAGDVAAAQRLFAEGADVNARDETGATLLMLAAHAGELPMINILIAAGADVNA